MRRTIQFEYTGRTALNVVGPISGVQYRFGRPGARVTIDARDAAAFARMPILTKSPGSLPEEMGRTLEQEEVHIAYGDRTWTSKAE
jgi:hypothetical protein